MLEEDREQMKLNEPGRQKPRKKNSQQQMKQAKLHSGLLQDLNKEPLVSLGSEKRGPSFLCLQCSMDKTLRGDRDRERERRQRQRERRQTERGAGGGGGEGGGRKRHTDRQTMLDQLDE